MHANLGQPMLVLLLAACSTFSGTDSDSLEPAALPLSGFGPHLAGWMRNVEYQDPGTVERKITLTVRYPAAAFEGTPAWTDAKVDASPDAADAPYPLILTATKVGIILGPHLASYGFVVAGVNGQDSFEHWGPWLTDHPRELLFALDQIAGHGIAGLQGMIDTDHASAMGYSFGGPTALFLGGARVDPEGYLQRCKDAPSRQPALEDWWIDYNCNMRGGWDAFVVNAGEDVTAGEEGLWLPITDDRIRAVIPMAPEGAWLFGERGLASVNRPTMLLAATEDKINSYELEAEPIYEQLPPEQRIMISFVGEGHDMIDRPARLAQMQHFVAAFFGLHLRGDKSLADYFSQEFIQGHGDLAWGVLQAE